MESSEILIKAGADLVSVGIRNTASIIHDRIKSAKTNKSLEAQNNELQDIINDLSADKAELLRIAQVYEQEFASQKITDDDIDFITENIFPILTQFISDEQVEDVNKVKKLLSKEMITILQLIGFNYKKAIGEPLTHLVSSFIESKAPKDSTPRVDQNEVLIAMVELAKDKEAFERLKEMMGWSNANGR